MKLKMLIASALMSIGLIGSAWAEPAIIYDLGGKFDKSFNYIFNSYYNGVGIYNPKEKRGAINRPLLEQVIKYRKHVDQHITDLLDKKNLTSKFKFLIELGINFWQVGSPNM